ncbi:unnamed protein product, partial [Ectocarpus sp. 12 AP-2014]
MWRQEPGGMCFIRNESNVAHALRGCRGGGRCDLLPALLTSTKNNLLFRHCIRLTFRTFDPSRPLARKNRSVWILADNLTTDVQSYSLVVNGAISPGTGVGAIERSSSTS